MTKEEKPMSDRKSDRRFDARMVYQLSNTHPFCAFFLLFIVVPLLTLLMILAIAYLSACLFASLLGGY